MHRLSSEGKESTSRQFNLHGLKISIVPRINGGAGVGAGGGAGVGAGGGAGVGAGVGGWRSVSRDG